MASPFPRGLVVLSGSSHPALAELIARRVGVSLCKVNLSKDESNETHVDIEDSVRGKDVFIVQTGSWSTNDAIMELLIMCYACKTASARQVIGVIPYLPYCKHSKMRLRGCITAKLLATMLSKAGMTHLITVDLYHKEIQGFFDFPVDNVRASPFLIRYITDNVKDYRNGVVVARYPGVTRSASAYAERLRLGLAVIHGEPKNMLESDEMEEDGRSSPPPSEELTHQREKSLSKPFIVPVDSILVKQKPPLNVVGDVHGRITFLIDDLIDDMDKLVAAAVCLKEQGSYKIYALATHGLLAPDSTMVEKLNESPIDELLVTNTMPQTIPCSKIKVIDISLILAEAVRRIYHGESMSQLFTDTPFLLED
eukprot:Em0020g280a